MTIQDWERKIFNKYGVKKLNDFFELKKYLTNEKDYAHNFTPEYITEGVIENDEFYGAYVFDENKIVNRNVISNNNSGWTTTIIFIASKDKISITNYFVHESNGLTRTEMDNFLKGIDLCW